MKTTTSRSRVAATSRKTSLTHNGHGNGEPSAIRSELKISPTVAAWLKKPKQNLIGGKCLAVNLMLCNCEYPVVHIYGPNGK